MNLAQYLTQDLIENFGDRKHKGRLSVIVDARDSEGGVYVVPKDREHIEFGLEIVGGDNRELRRLIPSHIGYDEVEGMYEIISVETGRSGMEEEHGNAIKLRHGQKGFDYIQEVLSRDFVRPREIWEAVARLEADREKEIAKFRRSPLRKSA